MSNWCSKMLFNNEFLGYVRTVQSPCWYCKTFENIATDSKNKTQSKKDHFCSDPFSFATKTVSPTVGADEGTWTPTVAHMNLNHARLPIPPHPHILFDNLQRCIYQSAYLLYTNCTCFATVFKRCFASKITSATGHFGYFCLDFYSKCHIFSKTVLQTCLSYVIVFAQILMVQKTVKIMQ